MTKAKISAAVLQTGAATATKLSLAVSQTGELPSSPTPLPPFRSCLIERSCVDLFHASCSLCRCPDHRKNRSKNLLDHHRNRSNSPSSFRPSCHPYASRTNSDVQQPIDADGRIPSFLTLFLSYACSLSRCISLLPLVVAREFQDDVFVHCGIPLKKLISKTQLIVDETRHESISVSRSLRSSGPSSPRWENAPHLALPTESCKEENCLLICLLVSKRHSASSSSGPI